MMKPLLLLLALPLGGCLDPGEPGNLVPKTVTEDPDLPSIAVNGSVFHSESFGDPEAPIVMVLHGGPGSDYRGLLPLKALADDGYRVVFWDQRGTGLSKRHDAREITLDVYLEDLRLVIEHVTAVPDQPLVFIGHSWGAMYATWFINEHGDYGGRVRGAILSDPGAFTKAQLDAYMKRLYGSVDYLSELANDMAWRDQFLSPADHARLDYLHATMAMDGAGPEHIDPANPNPSWRSGAVVNGRMFELAEKHGMDYTTHLKEFQPKVLFLRGSLFTANRLEHQQEMASSYANAEVVTMPNVGHEMIWERPTEYLEHTRAYFAEIGFEGGAP